jgi:hypothetical protein
MEIEGNDIMIGNNDELSKATWERIIKEKMVPLNLDRSASIYVLNDKKNSAVEIHFGTKYLIPPWRLSKMEPAVGRTSDTLDISSADFLVLNRNPAVKKCKQYIPWKKIFDIVFLDA